MVCVCVFELSHTATANHSSSTILFECECLHLKPLGILDTLFYYCYYS